MIIADQCYSHLGKVKIVLLSFHEHLKIILIRDSIGVDLKTYKINMINAIDNLNENSFFSLTFIDAKCYNNCSLVDLVKIRSKHGWLIAVNDYF